MRIQRCGHSTIHLTTDREVQFLIDPYISENVLAPPALKSAQFLRRIDALLVSHAHLDHAGGVADVVKVNPEVRVICHQDLSPVMRNAGARNIIWLDIGGTFVLEGVAVTMVSAAHGGAFGWVERRFGGVAAGFIISLESGLKVYYAGDTGLSADMKLIVGDYFKPDMAILPVGGTLTMDPEQAAYAAGELIKPRIVIPTHYYPGPEAYPDAAAANQRPEVARTSVGNGERTKALVHARYPQIEVIVLDIGESFDLGGQNGRQ